MEHGRCAFRAGFSFEICSRRSAALCRDVCPTSSQVVFPALTSPVRLVLEQPNFHLCRRMPWPELPPQAATFAFGRLYSKHHLNHFTTSSLKKLLESHELATVEVIRHNSPMAAIDLPKSSPLITAVLRGGVWIAFLVGKLLRRTMLQTIISKRAR